MNQDLRQEPWLDVAFRENQKKFPAEELLRYSGQHIAWSWDGARILASDPDRRILDQKLREAGIDPLNVIHDFVEGPNESYVASKAPSELRSTRTE
jgi:hypothetical protein